jgi:DUF1680 family protein
LGRESVRIEGGLLGQWQRRNVEATIPHVITRLREAGNLENLRRVADQDFAGAAPVRYPFLDTDIHKTLEGVAYVMADDAERFEDTDTLGLTKFYEECIEIISRAQREDGYLNSYFQSPLVGKEPFSDLTWGHELYTLGHLIQAAIAADRRLGDKRLLTVVTRFADLVVERFGPNGDLGICGHPEIEMALVELYRHTGERAYLDTAKLLVDRRGKGTMKHSVFPPEYFQDDVPLRELESVTGHAVRMVYLAAGATDVAIETDDQDLLEHLEYLWDDMVDSKLYLTGGLGARHSDEAIGDRFELPSERAYAETCAAIGTHQWAWRMYLATGKAKFLEVAETVLFNAFAVGTSADGCEFFYDNPLQRRPDHTQRSGAEVDGGELRLPWFVCPCCPPNVVRWVAELQDHLVVERDDVVEFAMPFTGRMVLDDAVVESVSDYPFGATWTLRVVEGSVPKARLRVPTAVSEPRLSSGGRTRVVGHGFTEVITDLQAGDEITLSGDLPVQAIMADARVDAVRGAVAFRRGPLVLCAEQQDQECAVDDLRVLPEAAFEATVTTAADSVGVSLLSYASTASGPLYSVYGPGTSVPSPGVPTEMNLIPYSTWGNREPGAMRVWFPRA